MDNNTQNYSQEDLFKDLKDRIDILKRKCWIGQEELEKKVEQISRLDKDIGQAERELFEYKSKTKKIEELWRDGEIEIEKLKCMQEKAGVILECNRRKNELQLEAMDIIKRNHSNLTSCAFKTVRQETARKIINREINNLADRKMKLENNLLQLQTTETENKNRLVRASTELMEIKARGETVLRLKNKLQESEASRINAIMKLSNLKTSESTNIDNSQLLHSCRKFE